MGMGMDGKVGIGVGKGEFIYGGLQGWVHCT